MLLPPSPQRCIYIKEHEYSTAAAPHKSPAEKKVPGLLVAPTEEGRGPLIWRKRPTKLHAFPNYL